MSISENKVWVLIPAAGIGSRMRSEIPKQYLSVCGATILEHTLRCFTDLSELAGIIVVVNHEDTYWQSLLQESQLFSNGKLKIRYTYGGSDRAETVQNGLHYLLNDIGLSDDQWVMVHDAARPCVRLDDLLALLAVRDDCDLDGAILGYRVKDTMKRSNADASKIGFTESRENLWHALTPQMFRLKELFDSLVEAKLAKHVVTDEASAMEFLGKKVGLVEGASDNIKLTSPSDLRLIEFLLKAR
ncbi:2-C-methyl-D-erythritol 4-phosphate cytidylyltransferase [Leucothrix arctica]|uniref:2-C-methyl-D-erythritol 4-phosphate cytidylyltransferase n=1 Tax=Leucothrix arctica TaxID=1481894 RepID=A0A317CBG5_9GAMM|nr:2-C-methyl-D-erythritol 4-phosphate cytidylyltransferase [Leucothrix arctica]PWQ95886.1 2-C-methyl-D-erythritol 4-phosphate cytidylyltransferase [Leucothrix arctica]